MKLTLDDSKLDNLVTECIGINLLEQVLPYVDSYIPENINFPMIQLSIEPKHRAPLIMPFNDYGTLILLVELPELVLTKAPEDVCGEFAHILCKGLIYSNPYIVEALAKEVGKNLTVRQCCDMFRSMFHAESNYKSSTWHGDLDFSGYTFKQVFLKHVKEIKE